MPPLVHLGSTFTKILSVKISGVSGNLNDIVMVLVVLTSLIVLEKAHTLYQEKKPAQPRGVWGYVATKEGRLFQ